MKNELIVNANDDTSRLCQMSSLKRKKWVVHIRLLTPTNIKRFENNENLVIVAVYLFIDK